MAPGFLGALAELRAPRLSVRPSVRTGRIFLKFDVREFIEHLSRNSNFIEIRQE
jgi:hypothetical protein